MPRFLLLSAVLLLALPGFAFDLSAVGGTAPASPVGRYPALVNIFDHPGLETTPLTPEQANAWFHALSLQPDIPFRYPDDGCFARAHRMAQLMEMGGVISVKLFAFANDDGLFTVSSPYAPGGTVKWAYHVAPAVLVRSADGKNNELEVIDPSLSDRLLTPKEWFALFVGQTPYHFSYRPRFAYAKDKAYSNFWLPADLYNMQVTNQAFLNAERSRGLSNSVTFDLVGSTRLASSGVVTSLRETESGLEVVLSQAAGVYRLAKSNPDFLAIATELRASFATRASVSLMVDTRDLSVVGLVAGARSGSEAGAGLDAAGF